MPELSLEQKSEYLRVVNSVITPANMHSEGSDLIGSFFMPEGFGLQSYSCLLYLIYFNVSNL